MPPPQPPSMGNFSATMHGLLAAFANFQNNTAEGEFSGGGRGQVRSSQRGRRNREMEELQDDDDEDEEWEDVDEEEEDDDDDDSDEEEEFEEYEEEEDDDDTIASEGEEGTVSQKQGKEEYMCCNHCGFPLCEKSMFFTDQIDVDTKTVYSYELEGDVLGLDSVWVYSATNPSSVRFDVARVKPKLNGRGVRVQKKFFADHSWFPGYAWANCNCASCGQHMGWGFRAKEEEPTTSEQTSSSTDGKDSTKQPVNPLAFIGLIITNTKNVEMSKAAIRARHKDLHKTEKENDTYWSTRENLMRLLRAMPDQLAANAFGMMVRNMDNHPAERRNLPALFQAVAAMQHVQGSNEEDEEEISEMIHHDDESVTDESQRDDAESDESDDLSTAAGNRAGEIDDDSGGDSNDDSSEDDESQHQPAEPSITRPVMREID